MNHLAILLSVCLLLTPFYTEQSDTIPLNPPAEEGNVIGNFTIEMNDTRNISSTPFGTTAQGYRDPEHVTWFIDTFLAPEENPIYRNVKKEGPTGEDEYLTFCNTFMHDYLVCMGFDGAEHEPYESRTTYYWYITMIQSVIIGDGKYYVEEIESDGWRCANPKAIKESAPDKQEQLIGIAQEVQSAANEGRPVIAIQHRHKGDRTYHHCFVVVPQQGELAPGQIAIAEAGSTKTTNTAYTAVTLGEGSFVLGESGWAENCDYHCSERYRGYPAIMFYIGA